MQILTLSSSAEIQNVFISLRVKLIMKIKTNSLELWLQLNGSPDIIIAACYSSHVTECYEKTWYGTAKNPTTSIAYAYLKNVCDKKTCHTLYASD